MILAGMQTDTCEINQNICLFLANGPTSLWGVSAFVIERRIARTIHEMKSFCKCKMR